MEGNGGMNAIEERHPRAIREPEQREGRPGSTVQRLTFWWIT